MKRLTIICLCLVILVSAVYLNRPVIAADEEVEACELWRTAGALDLYRCEDWEFDTVCYSQGIMLFCLPQQ